MTWMPANWLHASAIPESDAVTSVATGEINCGRGSHLSYNASPQAPRPFSIVSETLTIDSPPSSLAKRIASFRSSI